MTKQGDRGYFPTFQAITKAIGEPQFFKLMDQCEARLKAQGKVKTTLGLDEFTRMMASRIINDAPVALDSGSRRRMKRLLETSPKLFKTLIDAEINAWFGKHPKAARELRRNALQKLFVYPPDETLTRK